MCLISRANFYGSGLSPVPPSSHTYLQKTTFLTKTTYNYSYPKPGPVGARDHFRMCPTEFIHKLEKMVRPGPSGREQEFF
jgi:hypothetical protein